MLNKPTLVSLTGADDKVDIKILENLSIIYPEVEWAILYYPEREGTNRNPTAAWRERFLNSKVKNSAAHLCGQQVFKDLLDDKLAESRLKDLSRYGRVQVNINARRKEFDEQEVIKVYDRLYHAGITLILQYHEDSADLINNYLFTKMITSAHKYDMTRFNILFDGSKGKGVEPSSWPAILNVGGRDFYCGYAGGLGPNNVEKQVENIKQAVVDKNYWIDMESGIRTENELDLEKCQAVLDSSLGRYENSFHP